MKQLCKDPVAYVYEHIDGLQSTMLMMSGLVEDFNFAACQGKRRAPVHSDVFADAGGTHNVGQLFLTVGQQCRKCFLLVNRPILSNAHY